MDPTDPDPERNIIWIGSGSISGITIAELIQSIDPDLDFVHYKQ